MNGMDRQARGMAFYQKGGRLSVTLGKYDKKICNLPKGYPLLLPVEDVAIPFAAGGCFDALCVAAYAGLRQCECANGLSRSQLWKPSLFVIPAFPAQDSIGKHG